MIKLRIYQNVSREVQGKRSYSVEVWRESLDSFLPERYFDIFKICQRDGVKGYSAKHPASNILVKYANEGKFDLVYDNNGY